jgi:RecA-family ATPase
MNTSINNTMKDESSQNSKFISAFDLLMLDIDEVPCLVNPLLPSSGLGAVVGTSDSGKSCFCRQLAIAIATGEKDFLGFQLTPRTGRVIFVSTEDDKEATVSLLKKQVDSSLYADQNLKNLSFIFETEDIIADLDKRLTETPVDLVICDSYGDLFDKGDSNSNVQVRQFLNKYSALAKRHKCLVLFVHHIGKRTEGNEPSKHNVLGSQAFEAKMRVVVEIRPDEKNVRYLSPVKGNYLPSEMKHSSFVLVFDEISLTFSMTKGKVGYSEIVGNKTGGLTYKVNWQEVFGVDDSLKVAELSKRLLRIYGMPKGTVYGYIMRSLESVPGKHGIWRMKSDEQVPWNNTENDDADDVD